MPAKLSRLLFTILAFPIFIALTHCRASSTNKDVSMVQDSVVIKELGNEFTAEENASGTLVLYQQKRGADHAGRKLKYLVLRKSDNEIVREGEFQHGYVKWNDESSLAVLSSSSPTSEGKLEIIRLDKQ